MRLPTTRSTEAADLYGVPQGPILFLLYTADLLQLIRRHHLHPHAYADDTLRVLSSVRDWDAPATTVYLRRRSGALDDVSQYSIQLHDLCTQTGDQSA